MSLNINIFKDDDIITFLKLEKQIPHLLGNLRDQFEIQRLENRSTNSNEDKKNMRSSQASVSKKFGYGNADCSMSGDYSISNPKVLN